MERPVIEKLDHIALHVEDLEASLYFYQTVLGFDLLPRPNFDFDGAWLLAGDKELHLIGNRVEKPVSGSRSNHFAIQVNNLDAWEKWLTVQKYSFRPPKFRPDGVGQIFLFDPDGYVIELCEKQD